MRLVTVGAQAVVPDADSAGNGNKILAAVMGLKVGDHTQKGQLGVGQDVNPAIGEKADIEAEQLCFGLPRDRVGDLIADSPRPPSCSRRKPS